MRTQPEARREKAGMDKCAKRSDGAARIKICLACSHGGHLTEVLELEEAFAGHDTFYFSYDGPTTRRLKNAYLVPNKPRSPLAFARNLARLWRIFRKERPDLVVTTGAEIAIPVVLIAKTLRIPVLYIECSARTTKPSGTGRLLYWLADEFYIQWHELVSAYGPRAMFRGSLVDEDRPIAGDRSAERRMRAALVHPAQLGAFSSDQPPMGLGYIASALEQRGCEVRVIDANVEKLRPQDVADILAVDPPGLVGFTLATPVLPSAFETVRRIRTVEPRPVLVAGGPHATVAPAEVLEEGGFDYVVRGEGEDTMAELAQCLLSGGEVADVAGVSWRQDGRVIHNADRTLRPDIGGFPYPDWSLFPLKRYSSLVRRNDFCLPIATSRGCPFGCTFCYKGVFGRKLRMRTPDDVVHEWAFLIERYGAREIAVLDDAFSFDIERAVTICEQLVERGLHRVPWSTTNGIRVDNACRELFEAMTQAGCYRTYFGIESGVERILKSLDKGITIDQARAAVRMAKQAGLEVGGYFMLGNLGETAQDMDATIALALELDLDYAQFSIATPYPGTRMYEQVQAEGALAIDSWEDLATYGRPVVVAGELTPDLVASKYRKAIRSFYLRPRIVLRQIRECFRWTGLKHRLVSAWLLVRFSLFGGRKGVTV